VLHAVAKETEAAEAAIESVRAQFFPQTADVLLGVHEAQFELAVDPPDQTLQQRRQTVMASWRGLTAEPSGRNWQEKVTALVGNGWDYAEHDPDDPTSPAVNTVRVVLPSEPTSAQFGAISRLLRRVTPAHVALVITTAGGFALDSSLLDEDAFGS
jgi:hypothetical protein